MTTLEKQIDIGCCRICLISKVNCVNCRFAFAIPTVLAERYIEDIRMTPSQILNFCIDSIEPEMLKIIVEDIDREPPFIW